jgi:hypothetical protein
LTEKKKLEMPMSSGDGSSSVGLGVISDDVQPAIRIMAHNKHSVVVILRFMTRLQNGCSLQRKMKGNLPGWFSTNPQNRGAW